MNSIDSKIIGQSQPAVELKKMIGLVSSSNSPVIINGPTGSGKELVAEAIHEESRRKGNFIALNCAAIPSELMEAEIFGFEKGAFTGAKTQRDGAFQRADGGTLFLDEIGELPPPLQSKLLRALESGEVRRIGSTKVSFPDVRVVAATNRNLVQRVHHQEFRNDLYWRLSALTVELPPLRERLEDIPELASTILAKKHPDAQLTSGALMCLGQHKWPGNVRELGNVLTRAYILHGSPIYPHHLEFDSLDELVNQGRSPDYKTPTVEYDMLRDALKRADGNKAAAARSLGMARTSFIYRLKKARDKHEPDSSTP